MLRDIFQIFVIFLKLGLTSFGGPIAQIGFFHNEFVNKRKWLDEHAYADLVALCQFLPGPASSQVGIALGLSRAGLPGAIAAWMGFTIPSALLLYFFAIGATHLNPSRDGGWLHGLKIVAVAVVAQAIWKMTQKLCPDFKRKFIALLATLCALCISSSWAQVAVIFNGGLLGILLMTKTIELPHSPFNIRLNSMWGFSALALFAILILILPVLANQMDIQGLKLFDSFFRTGSLVFGGGHVVLPLLKNEVVTTGWVTSDQFMAGYGAAQAVPGPLFTFSAYLGAVSKISPSAFLGALICLVGAFLPSLLLLIGTLPFWETLRKVRTIRLAMLGINASVVGLLISAFFNPVWTSAIFSAKDLLLAVIFFLLLQFGRIPSWVLVVLGTLVGHLE